ncbi:LEA type 2 family protein [Candidatus Woesearchaeota archaeon]|nr:LEA type 2 family protein [Candidatus Woesearchaeota archaeon]
MNFLVRWMAGLLIPVIVLGAAGYYFIKDLDRASLERFELDGISGVTTNSFTFSGNLVVKNPSKAPIPIQTITYDVILQETGETISSGTLPSFLLSPGSNTIPFEQRVNWVPTATLAAQLVTEDHVYAVVQGRIRIDLPQIDQYEIPFKKTVDIKQYILPFAKAPLPLETLSDEVDTVTPASDKGILPDVPLDVLP